MKFRTEIVIDKAPFSIDYTRGVLMLGSCFTDNIGSRMQRDGFDVTSNPLGPLYNPLSLAAAVHRARQREYFDKTDFFVDSDGRFHCLDYASRYSSGDSGELAKSVNAGLDALSGAYFRAEVVIITFGSAFVYSLTGDIHGAVGNCHKLAASLFRRLSLSVDDIVSAWMPLVELMNADGKHVIFTVSPIRHFADGLHGNTLSKSRLHLACDAMSDVADYFPAYEIMNDDLRDYRFYKSDLKHPTDMACDYIYEKFGERYFSADTLTRALESRRQALQEAHRPILRPL